MRMSWLMCVLMGTFAWGQGNVVPAPPAQGAISHPMEGVKPQGPAPADASASVPAAAAVITVEGVCPAESKTAGTAKGASAARPASAKTPTDACKTVITKAEFEKLAGAVAPSMTPQLRKQLAGVLPRFIAMSEAAKKQGLDKTPQYMEMIKFAKMQILTNALQRQIQEEAAKVPPADIEAYYKNHPEMFEEATLERLFVPRTKQIEEDAEKDEDKDKDKDEKLTEEQRKAKLEADKDKAEQNEQAMTKLAEDLRARAAAGEDFMKLQKEAFEAAGMKIESPTIALPKIRKNGLPPAHAAVFDLKAGEVSQVINDSGGHYIYKMTAKDQLTLDQAREEIHGKLQNERAHDMMDKLNGSYKVETNEAYFGPGGPGMPAPPRMAAPRMAPRSMAPPAQPQTPAAQAPTPAPAAKPN